MVIAHQEFYQEVGRRIRVAREQSRLTQAALATKVSLTRTTVTNIEKGRQQLLVHTLVEIAKALDVALESLLPEPQAASITELLKAQSPQAQAWIQQFDIDDRE